ncbi:alpha/beta fold hydrolase [Shimia sp. MIT910701]|jgi:pimeloyl-ACP methyl ester carboxylesterase|uniref:alpha/beta fold hydrolase n=1 Tax=Shimia sp. MIT910701 TaxID=3096987 RepID=UPI003999CEEC
MTTSPQAPVFFCHGVPGCPQDAAFLATNGRVVVAPNLLACEGSAPLEHLASTFGAAVAQNGGQAFHVVGFSIGAMAALRLAAERPKQVARVTVVSPAAPLQLGEFLPDMAGAPVFKLAMKRPRVLRMLTAAQGLLARNVPGMLIKQLFAKCGVQERALLADPQFVTALTEGMRNSFVTHRAGYLAYLAAYVADWSDVLRNVQAPVEIWHGDKDTWAPLEMADAIKDLVPSSCVLHVVPNGEHYSTLKAVRLG